jgi:hypothetical protein
MINSYTSWQPLEEVIVGRVYSADYFDFITDAQVRCQLQQILNETEEDLNNLKPSKHLEQRSYGLICPTEMSFNTGKHRVMVHLYLP